MKATVYAAKPTMGVSTKTPHSWLVRRRSIRSRDDLNSSRALASQKPSGISYSFGEKTGGSSGPCGLEQRMGRNGMYSRLSTMWHSRRTMWSNVYGVAVLEAICADMFAGLKVRSRERFSLKVASSFCSSKNLDLESQGGCCSRLHTSCQQPMS